MDRHRFRHLGDQRGVPKGGEHVERHPGRHGWGYCDAAGARQHQGVAVRGGARRGFERGDAAGAGAVLRHHGLAQPRAQRFGEEAAEQVGGAAGDEGDEQPDGPVREVLRGRRPRQHGAHSSRECRAPPHHPFPPRFPAT
jgi:hypothetical protein